MTLRLKIRRRNRLRESAIILSVLVLLTIAGGMLKDHMFASLENMFGQRPRCEIMYEIASGDTLWLLASQTVQPDEDIRDKIIAIRKLNGLTPTQSLTPGQIVKIPVRSLDDSGLRYTLRPIR